MSVFQDMLSMTGDLTDTAKVLKLTPATKSTKLRLKSTKLPWEDFYKQHIYLGVNDKK